MRAQLPTSKCCLCGESFKGFGHNVSPVRKEGVACDTCNGAMCMCCNDRRPQHRRATRFFAAMRCNAMLLLLPFAAGAKTAIAKHRRNFDDSRPAKLQSGKASDFHFGRFKSLSAIKSSFDDCRSPKSFKFYKGKDGRFGHVCSTKLGGDWVLAESDQMAPDCTCEQVIRAYLDGRLQKQWSADKVIDVKTTRMKQKGGEQCYSQDLVLHSQRIIRSHTGVMRYSQRITVDKIGSGNYCAFVELDPDKAMTAKRPFNSLAVYIGLEQQGKDVRIYASGVFEVNRQVVPNLIVFDASGIAGDMAGKGTLWLAGEFARRQTIARSAGTGAQRARRLVEGARDRFKKRLQVRA